ncbi:MAG: serine/threonine protein kinase [Actinomycetia bacterium]|nr:serine/threonine protein kinase [Actinomycetes bacterium]
MIGQIFSNYKLIDVIGKGDMSTVFLARSINTGALSALKVLKSEYTQDEEHINRFFKKKIKITRELEHVNILKLLNFGKKKDWYYLIYEHVAGVCLDVFIIREKSLSIKEIEKILLQVLRALSYAHQKEIVHRDIKPQNILITSYGLVKINDFGIAKALSSKTVTQTGLFMGSPGYISPEQAEGKKVDRRSDLYSVGVLLFELLSGSLPFKSDNPYGYLHKHINIDPPDIEIVARNIPDHLIYITKKCLKKKRSERFNSADEIIKVLQTNSFAVTSVATGPISNGTITSKEDMVQTNKSINSAGSPTIVKGPGIKQSNYETSAISYTYSYYQPIRVFIVLMILTFGLYQVIWFCRNWYQLNKQKKLGIRHFWRTIGLFIPILNLILIYGQLSDVSKYARDSVIKKIIQLEVFLQLGLLFQ